MGWDDGGEHNEFLPFMRYGDKYSVLSREPYTGRGLDRAEKVVLVEALLWHP